MTAVMQLCAAVLLAAATARAAPADEAPDLRRLFPQERDVFVAENGLVRLAVPPDVLAACRPDLSDLRVFDRQNREVPYIIDAGVPPGRKLEMVRSRDAVITDVQRAVIEREDGPPLYRETYVIDPPPAADVGWDLVFDVARPRFTRRVVLAVVAADGSARPLPGEHSIFRLSEPPATKNRLALPTSAGERLAVTIEGEDDGGGYLGAGLHFETAHDFAPRQGVRVELEEIARERRDGRTAIELVRPRGLVPDALQLETATGSFNRDIQVWDENPGRDAVLLGRTTLFRLQGAVPVEERALGVQPARGERLRVEIDDGDSPPLEEVRIAAVVRQPVLIFELNAAGDAPAGTLRFGGGRAQSPRYDLAGLLPQTGTALDSRRADAAAQLAEAAESGRARLGETRANPAYDGAPALAFAMRPSAVLDARAYTHRRPLAVRPSPDGLSRVRLTAADAARARPDLGDVRVVDAQSRQWPYLLQADAARSWQPLAIDGPRQRRNESQYRLRLPVAPLAIDQLVLESDASFFDRAYRLTALDADDNAIALTAGRLVLRAEHPRPVALGFPAVRVTALELTVEDGDEAPLAFRAAYGRAIEAELFLAAPAGDYVLLVGEPDVAAPRYELERIRDVILAVNSGSATTGDLAPNPDYSMSARLAAGGGGTLQRVLLWGVLIAAVVVLALVTLRVARSA